MTSGKPAIAVLLDAAADRVAMLRRPWIIWYAVVLHTLWGILLLFSDDAFGSTALSVLRGPSPWVSLFLFAIAGGAAWGITRRPTGWTLVAMLPQQAVMVGSAAVALMSIIGGHYSDGVARPQAFILADQAPVIVTMVLHSLALLELHLRRTTGLE